jgi:hypothetical protein
MPCGSCKNQRFRGTYGLQQQVKKSQRARSNVRGTVCLYLKTWPLGGKCPKYKNSCLVIACDVYSKNCAFRHICGGTGTDLHAMFSMCYILFPCFNQDLNVLEKFNENSLSDMKLHDYLLNSHGVFSCSLKADWWILKTGSHKFSFPTPQEMAGRAVRNAAHVFVAHLFAI